MDTIQKISLANLPTPLEHLTQFSHSAQIYLKRDDYTGLITSGNKIRKLEYCLAEALNQKADTILTAGAIQSNHCRTTVACCRKLGLSPVIFVCGEDKKPYDGNLLLSYLMGADIKFINPELYTHIDDIMAEYSTTLSKQGKRPYCIPIGASNEVGVLGYVDCMAEIKDIVEREKIEALYAAVGSGGTYAGLLIGKKIHQIPLDIHGIIVCNTTDYFIDKIIQISKKAIDRFGFEVTVEKKDISLLDGYIGPGYALPYPEVIETVVRLAAHGVFLDVAYTGKAFVGMLHESKHYKKILFLHTGGIFSVFSHKNEFFPA